MYNISVNGPKVKEIQDKAIDAGADFFMLLPCSFNTYPEALAKLGQYQGMLNAWTQAGWLKGGGAGCPVGRLFIMDETPADLMANSGEMVVLHPRDADPILSAIAVLRHEEK